RRYDYGFRQRNRLREGKPEIFGEGRAGGDVQFVEILHRQPENERLASPTKLGQARSNSRNERGAAIIWLLQHVEPRDFTDVIGVERRLDHVGPRDAQGWDVVKPRSERVGLTLEEEQFALFERGVEPPRSIRDRRDVLIFRPSPP